MDEYYIPGFTNSLSSGTQGLPTAQPVQTEPYTLDLGDWSPSDVAGLQNLFGPQAPNEIDRYIAEQAALGNEVVSLNPYQGTGLDAISGNIYSAFNPFDPSNPGATTGSVYRFDTGNDIGVPDGNGGFTYRNSGQVTFQPGQTYQMTDKTGQVIGTASTPEEMAKLVQQSENVPFYNLSLTANPNTGVDYGGMMPSKTDAGSLESMLLNMAALALPAVGGAALGPVLAGSLGVSAPIGVGLGTAAGTAASGALAGKSIEDILLQSALAGVASGGLAALTAPGAPSAFDKAFSPEYASWLASGTGAAPAFSGAVGGFGGTGGGGGGSIAGTDAGGNFIQVLGSAGSKIPTSFLSSALGAASGALSGTNYGDRVWGDQASNTDSANADNTNEIVVTANKPTTKLPDSVGAVLATIPSLAANVPQTPNAPTDPKKKLGTKEYLQLAGLGLGLLGDLTGKKSPGTIPGGMGASSIFSAQLPTANLPAATQRPASALPQTTQDWYRYGYGPEQSFFSHVPQGGLNTSTAYTGYAHGGYAVGGPGDGRDDKIPAMLSDGEYVMDAETVALLGNGSPKAGADALDKFRVAVRKHKGRDLAKGKFSANAKKPDQYLKGRK